MYIHTIHCGNHTWLTDDINDSDLKAAITQHSDDPDFAVHDIEIKGVPHILAVKSNKIDVTDKAQCIAFSSKLTYDVDLELYNSNKDGQNG